MSKENKTKQKREKSVKVFCELYFNRCAEKEKERERKKYLIKYLSKWYYERAFLVSVCRSPT